MVVMLVVVIMGCNGTAKERVKKSRWPQYWREIIQGLSSTFSTPIPAMFYQTMLEYLMFLFQTYSSDVFMCLASYSNR